MSARTPLANTAFNLAGLAVTSALALALTPFLLLRLGEEMFGLWALGGVLITAAPLAALGLGRALARNVAQALAAGRADRIRGDFNGSWWVTLITSWGLAAAGWILAAPLARGLGAPPALLPLAVELARLLLLALPAAALAQILVAVIEGSQRMAFSSSALTLSRLTFAAGATVAVLGGWGVRGVAIAHLLSAWAHVGLLLLALRRVTPGLRLVWQGPAAPDLRRDLRFGGLILAGQGVGLAFVATNKIVLARAVSLESVAWFEFGAVMAMQLFNLATAAANAYYPALAAAQTAGGWSQVQRLFLQALRLLGLSILPLAVLLTTLARPFVAAWFGQLPAPALQALHWLIPAWALAGLATAAAAGYQATGAPGRALLFALYNMLLNLLLALLLAPVWGFGGVLAGNVIAVASSSLLTLYCFARRCAVGLRHLRTALPLRLWGWLGALAGLWWWGGGQIAAPWWPGLVGLAALFAVVFLAGLWALRLLPPGELARFRRKPAGVGEEG